MDKSLILTQIRNRYGFKTDKDFAEFLGVGQNVISNWRGRNTYNIKLITSKCEDVNGDYLLTGKGFLFKDDEINTGIKHENEMKHYEQTISDLKKQVEYLTEQNKIMFELIMKNKLVDNSTLGKQKAV